MRRGGALPVIAALLLAACGGDPSGSSLHGYVDADYVLVGAEASGRLTALPVARGQTIDAGALLFTLDDRDQRAALDQARAALAEAKASLDDLRTGKRPE